jgi:hypothetical protein
LARSLVKLDRPNIIKNFLTEEETSIVESFLDRKSTPSPVEPNHRAYLGYPGYKVASKIGTEIMADPLTGNAEDDEAIHLITDIYDRVRILLEKYYSRELLLVQASYTEISPGFGMGLHSDMYWLNGEIRDDDISVVMKYSAVLYLNTGEVDFTGGGLYFSVQDYRYTSNRSDLIHFIGDMDHLHTVEPVISGKRKSLSMFYGFREEVLE